MVKSVYSMSIRIVDGAALFMFLLWAYTSLVDDCTYASGSFCHTGMDYDEYLKRAKAYPPGSEFNETEDDRKKNRAMVGRFMNIWGTIFGFFRGGTPVLVYIIVIDTYSFRNAEYSPDFSDLYGKILKFAGSTSPRFGDRVPPQVPESEAQERCQARFTRTRSN